MIDRVYKLFQGRTGTLGIDGCGGAINGELTQGSFHKIAQNFYLSSDSVVLDIGSGGGKPSMHIAASTNGVFSIGIELLTLRHNLSLLNHQAVLNDNDDHTMEAGGRTCYVEGNIEDVQTLAGFSHLYMFDKGAS